ncbi:unnamed protein product [Protopolystoma xenopodis]|uniref:Uncharacterized protein n=1 Tax=Protopolystoma xenopodis TaxID=117903 RepID=A0A3S5BPF0_9PLAT|nr:unnamed protein product [Protopolystoma xenopodis]
MLCEITTYDGTNQAGVTLVLRTGLQNCQQRTGLKRESEQSNALMEPAILSFSGFKRRSAAYEGAKLRNEPIKAAHEIHTDSWVNNACLDELFGQLV